MGRTKKVGIAGKYGTRYGTKMRANIIKVGAQKKHTCPDCKKEGVKRVSAGIWECKKCGLKFAGKAYKPG